jgi:hypothetical protein
MSRGLPFLLLVVLATPSRAAPPDAPAAAVSAFHEGMSGGDAARARGAIGEVLMMTGGAYSGEPRDWQAHQYLRGPAIDRWVSWMLANAGPFSNRWEVDAVSQRGDAAIVVTRETGSNKFRSWSDEIVTWHLGRDDGRWRIVGMFIRDLRNPEVERARAEAVAAIRKLGGSLVIDEAAPGRPVTRIDLHDTAATDELLEKLVVFPELRELDLRKTAVGDRGAAHLARLAGLRSLNLFRTTIGDATLERLRGLRELDTLLVGGTRITDAGLAHLAGLRKLRKLSVFDTAVGDAGARRLGALPSLEVLLIAKSKVTDAGARELQRARPGLRFSEET